MKTQDFQEMVDGISSGGSGEYSTFAKQFLNAIDLEDVRDLDKNYIKHVIDMHQDLAEHHTLGVLTIRIRPYSIKQDSRNIVKTVIDIVTDDMAFVIDTVSAELTRKGYTIEKFLHPLIGDADEEDKDKITRVHLHIILSNTLSKEETERLETRLQDVLTDTQYANRDWKIMRRLMLDSIQSLENTKTLFDIKLVGNFQAFLKYLHDHNFTLLGVYDFDLREAKSKGNKTESAHGILSNQQGRKKIDFNEEGLPRWKHKNNTHSTPVVVSKLKTASPVHRMVPLDCISVVHFDDMGNAVLERIFLGLFTAVTYSRSIEDIPYIRHKAERIIERSGFNIGGHDYKALCHILERYPRDELLQIDEDTLYETAISILRLQHRPRIALFMRVNPYSRTVSCLTYVPKERYETRLRLKIQEILERELQGECLDYYYNVDDSELARVLYILSTDKADNHDFSNEGIEKIVQEECTPWRTKLALELDDYYEDIAICGKVTEKYVNSFPVDYKEKTSPQIALADIAKLEEAACGPDISINLHRKPEMDSTYFSVKIYKFGKVISLSEIMPVFENMGLGVIGEHPYEVTPQGQDTKAYIYDFTFRTDTKIFKNELDRIKPLFEEAFLNIWQKLSENDGLNKLVFGAYMTWREILILRTYVRYMMQIPYAYSRLYVEKALTDHPKISRLIVDLFKALHDPANGDQAEIYAAGCSVGIDHALEMVDSLDQDRILQTVTALIDSTLRTNYFQNDENGTPKPYISLKLKSEGIKELPLPKPFREIFVYSPRFEGVHLRGDKIARGGLRWSDRQEDYRTEILDLMKAQTVKNSVIVPMGAKGGFILKKNMAGKPRDDIHKEGIACYQMFLRGMLDITDNKKGGEIFHPENVVIRDEPDPYLVVAADKGTATFSDTANAIAKEYDFWLGDAFASGGSAGYDHKKMGITARGAWESVKRHFRELGHNTQLEEFDVIGVGDMGGDVFGNGMLLSEKICLVGAFNHIHIFCDPEPDPDKSFRERKRVFDASLGWDQYNEKILSKGGRIFSRMDKILELTPEIKKRFQIEKDKITPIELIQAMLTAETDLLWFGGIGTYVKSSRESHSDVGDKSNDLLRVDASEIRARVIGEGANLGLTQKGRIEFAQKGGKVNADFIDNSGGVDCSDHEVNIKILFQDLLDKHNEKIDIEKRNALLKEMEEDVAALVLKNNYDQAQGISLMEIESRDNVMMHADLIAKFEEKGVFQRKVTGLPEEEEIQARSIDNKGLTRPELAIILSFAKIQFSLDLLNSELPDSVEAADYLYDYFPAMLSKNYKDAILNHSLKREIISTALSSQVINKMGAGFIYSLSKQTGLENSEIAKAYMIVKYVFDTERLWHSVEKLDTKVKTSVLLEAQQKIKNLIYRECSWFLKRLGRDLSIAKDTATYKSGLKDLKNCIDKVVTTSISKNIKKLESGYAKQGLPKKLAHEIALIPVMGSACDIIRISKQSGVDIQKTASTYFELGDFFHLQWLKHKARLIPTDDKWAEDALNGLVDQLYTCQAGLTARILKDMGDRLKEKNIVANWAKDHAHQTSHIKNLMAEIRRSSIIDMPAVIIAEQRLRALYGG